MNSTNDRDANKLCEFVAHSSHVTCTSIAPKTRHVASGATDGNIGLWQIDNAAHIASFSSNRSAISCMCFEDQEQILVSGAVSGAVKVFDVAKQKVVRHLKGHQVHVMDVRYHPSGDFIASGGKSTAL